MFAKIQLYHIGRNRNGSAVTQEAANNSLSGIKYKPVLASIITDEETGIEDFNGHDMEFDDDGNVTYIEKQVGCFTAQDAYIAHDDEHDKDYVFAQCAIPRDYTHAADIIERKGGTDVSVELLVNACSFNAKEKYLELTETARRYIPDLVLTTDVIVGFPGETEDQFRELLDFVKETEFDRLGAFAYSPEEGTPAAKMPDQIPDEIKQERLDRLIELRVEEGDTIIIGDYQFDYIT